MSEATTITLTASGSALIAAQAVVDAGVFIKTVRAVLPHAADDPESPLHRVRLILDPDGHLLEAQASSGFTAVVHHVERPGLIGPFEHRDGDGMWQVDLAPVDVLLLCRTFKPARDQQITLRWDLLADQRLQVTDTSGLFDGRSMIVAPVGDGEQRFPDVRRLIRDQLVGEAVGMSGPVAFGDDALSRFVTGAPFTSHPTLDIVPPSLGRRAWLVLCGDELCGLLMPVRRDDIEGDVALGVKRWRGWLA